MTNACTTESTVYIHACDLDCTINMTNTRDLLVVLSPTIHMIHARDLACTIHMTNTRDLLVLLSQPYTFMHATLLAPYTWPLLVVLSHPHASVLIRLQKALLTRNQQFILHACTEEKPQYLGVKNSVLLPRSRSTYTHHVCIYEE
jgi:hypothetical protein